MLIDAPTVLADLQAIVSQYGNGYVYKLPPDSHECVYIEPTLDGSLQPSCLVGHVLARHGLLVRQYATDNVAFDPDGGDSALIPWFYRDFTPRAVQVLTAAQKAQDGDATWGEALIAAKEAANQ